MRKGVMIASMGIILGLSFHAPFFTFLAFLSLPYYIHIMIDERSLKKSLKYQFLYTFFYHLCGSCWLLSALNLEHLGATLPLRLLVVGGGWILLSFAITLPYLIIPIVLNGFKQDVSKRLLLLVLTYASVEFLMEFTELGFPWFRLGILGANSNEGLWLASIGGVYLCTIMILVLSYVFLHTYYHKRKYAWFLFFILIALFNPSTPHIEEEVIVSLIQPNISTSAKWDEEFERINEEVQLNLINQSEGIVFLAETVVLNNQGTLQAYLDVTDKEIYYGAIREYDGESYNVLLNTYDNTIYAKQHLVPLGEYVPQLLSDILPLTNSINMGNDLSKGTNSNLFDNGSFKIGGIICFEDIYPSLVSKSVRTGANLLYVASTDGWFNENEMYQHKLHAILRSAENHRSVVRVGNTGMTFITNPSGEVSASIDALEANILKGYVAIEDNMSVYNQFGRFLPYVVLLYIVSSLHTIKREEWVLLWGGI